MKKLAAILLICLLAFNWYGFRIVTSLLAAKADQRLETSLDAHEYDESALIEISVPLHVPYQTNSSDFERHYGEIEVDGVFYTYVKSKVENGNLVLKCISNDLKKEIRDAGNDYFKKANGLEQDQSGKKTSNTFAKQSVADYDDQMESFAMKAFDGTSSPDYLEFSSTLSSNGTNIPGQPPEYSAS